MSMLESLIGGAPTVPQDRSFQRNRRLPPERVRDLFDLLGTLGDAASIRTFNLATIWDAADARKLFYGILERWPEPSELPPASEAFSPRVYAQKLIAGDEFAEHFVQRLLGAFPEKQRIFYVHIPRCAGGAVLETLSHSFFRVPGEIPDGRDRCAALGLLLRRLGTTPAFAVTIDRLVALLAYKTAEPTQSRFSWRLPVSPLRGTDQLFTVVRDPLSILVSEVEARCRSLRAGQGKAPGWLGTLPAGTDDAGWRQVAGKLLQRSALANPICTALGEGSAESAMATARRCDLRLVTLDDADDFFEQRFNLHLPPREPAGSLFGANPPEDAERRAAFARCAEDRIFWDRLMALRATGGDPSVDSARL